MAGSDEEDCDVISVKTNLRTYLPKVNAAVTNGAFKSLSHAGAAIRKTAQQSMREAKGPSPPGTPPHVHTGRLRRSILFAVDKQKHELVVGPSYDKVKIGGRPSWLAQMLEHGGTFQRRMDPKRSRRGRPRKGEEVRRISVTYPARPFMAPALAKNLARFHREWQGAIG